MNFKSLHYQETPLLIGNVWDVESLRIAEKLNFQAVGTSSSAIAKLLGYEDGEEMTFEELEYIVQRMMANTNLPLSVDLESGYNRDPLEIANHLQQLADIGVVGFNIEDSIVVDEKRTFLDASQFAKTISEVKNHLRKNNINTFLNIRTDVFLLGHSNPIVEAKRRIQLYEQAGADGIFLPCIEKEEDIKMMVTYTNLPINVMCMPQLPDFEKLEELGVKRISMGNFLFDDMYKYFESKLNAVVTQKSFRMNFIK